MSNKYVAHSAPDETPPREPHWYVDHVRSVEEIGMIYAEKMLDYATCFSSEQIEQTRSSLIHALRIHDIGKLDLQNQAVLYSNSGRLPYDHVDGGVAVAMKNKDKIAAWLVRAHHAPGLASLDVEKVLTKRISPENLLRGKRYQRDCLSKDHISAHKHQIDTTNELRNDLIRAHESACDHKLTVNQTDYPQDALTMRFLLACLVDADHGDTAAYYAKENSPPISNQIEPRWQERLQNLAECVRNLQSLNEDRQRLREELFEQCLYDKKNRTNYYLRRSSRSRKNYLDYSKFNNKSTERRTASNFRDRSVY